MLSRDYRSAARNALRGNWGISVLVALVASLLGGAGSPLSGAGGGAVGSSASSSGSQTGSSFASQFNALPDFVLAIIAVVLTLLVVYALVTIIVGGAVRLGFCSYNIDLITERKIPAFSTLFSRFHIFGRAFALQFMISLFTAAWTLLFIIPGIVASYRYAMAPYLMAENPNLGVMEAINLSKQMMQGNKWRLFKLHFSFIGWLILGGFTLGIGYLWLNPYIFASEAAFFLDLAGRGPQTQSFPNGPEMA